jgi:hypothetical protein
VTHLNASDENLLTVKHANINFRHQPDNKQLAQLSRPTEINLESDAFLDTVHDFMKFSFKQASMLHKNNEIKN